MKNYPPPSPRLTCRLARGALTLFGDTSPGQPRGPGAAHAAACPACREFFGACVELESALRRDAAGARREAPAGLERDILRAIALSARPRAARHSPAGWFSFVGVAAATALAGILAQKPFAPPPPDPASPVSGRVIVASDLFVEMPPQAKTVLQQDPLQQEVDAIASDARTAMRFLARNFLPDSAVDSSGGE